MSTRTKGTVTRTVHHENEKTKKSQMNYGTLKETKYKYITKKGPQMDRNSWRGSVTYKKSQYSKKKTKIFLLISRLYIDGGFTCFSYNKSEYLSHILIYDYWGFRHIRPEVDGRLTGVTHRKRLSRRPWSSM